MFVITDIEKSIESERESGKQQSVILPPLTQPKKVELVGLTIVRMHTLLNS